MPERPERPSGSGPRLLLWVERLLMIAGIAVLTWCAMLVAESAIAQRMARSSLNAAAVVEKPVWPPVLASTPEPAAGEIPARGSPVGTLSIPRVDLSAVVLHGSDAQTLRRGPGHLENTALPGSSGNVVIAGHRDSFFWPLRNIQLGDDIFIDTPKGRFRYRVASVRVANPRDVSVLRATDEPVLTLITCYPFWVFGNAPDRFVVRATAVGPGGASNRHARADSDGGVVNDDDVLVRLAVERYRLTHNGRLISRNEIGATGLVTFEACDVTVTGDRATASCRSDRRGSSALEPTDRTFTLERAAGQWAIRTIVVR